MLDAILIGATALDVIAKVDKFPEVDKTVLAKEVIKQAGGSISNIAVGLSRLGFKVGFVGKVGNDIEGEFLLESLRRENMDVSRVIIAEGHSASTFIAVNKEGERIIFALGGKALLERAAEIPKEYLRASKCLVIGETLPEVSKGLSEYLRRYNQKQIVIYVPGSIIASYGLEYSKDILKYSHIVVLNEKEIIELTENKNVEKSVHALLNRGIKYVVLTLGRKGACIYTKNQKICVPPFKIKTVDTTGAGDAFTAGIIYAFTLKYSLRNSLIFASACAAISTTKMGAREGLPTLKKIKKFIASTQ